MKPALSLRTERLAELTTDELHVVAGAYRDVTLGKLCATLGAGCASWQQCTTAMSCGCQHTDTCA